MEFCCSSEDDLQNTSVALVSTNSDDKLPNTCTEWMSIIINKWKGEDFTHLAVRGHATSSKCMSVVNSERMFRDK